MQDTRDVVVVYGRNIATVCFFFVREGGPFWFWLPLLWFLLHEVDLNNKSTEQESIKGCIFLGVRESPSHYMCQGPLGGLVLQFLLLLHHSFFTMMQVPWSSRNYFKWVWNWSTPVQLRWAWRDFLFYLVYGFIKNNTSVFIHFGAYGQFHLIDLCFLNSGLILRI